MERDFRNRRRNYFIKKKFQTKFIIKFCVLVMIGSLISGAVIYAMSRSTLTTTFENSRLTIKTTADYILPAVILGSAIVIVVIGLATIFVTLFTSHRIAGPLYRMEKDVAGVAGGNLNVRFTLRQSDELKPLAQGLDTMVRQLKERVRSVKAAIAELESAVETPEKGETVREKLDAVKSSADRLIT